MTYQTILTFTFIATALAGCPKLHHSKPSHKACEKDREGIETCSFSCPSWTDLIGHEVVKCLPEIGEWNHIAPICAPNFFRCGRGMRSKTRCPAIKDSDLIEVRKQDFKLSKKEKKAVRELTMIYRAMRAMRLPIIITRNMCQRSLCPINCLKMKWVPYNSQSHFRRRNLRPRKCNCETPRAQ